MSARRSPTKTVYVPDRAKLDRLLALMIERGETFTVEPSTTQPGVWHVDILDSALPLLAKAFGPVRDVDVGDLL